MPVRGFDTSATFAAIFNMGNNFCDFLLAFLKGHREPIVIGLLTGAKRCTEAWGSILCKATCDSLIIKVN